MAPWKFGKQQKKEEVEEEEDVEYVEEEVEVDSNGEEVEYVEEEVEVTDDEEEEEQVAAPAPRASAASVNSGRVKELESQLAEEQENISLLQDKIKDLEEEDKMKDKEIAKLNKAILKAKSKKDMQNLNTHEEARMSEEQAMQQVRALQEMVRNQPASSRPDISDSVEMQALQRTLDSTQLKLKETESRLNEAIQEKTKLEQTLFRAHQDYQDLKKSIEARIATQGEALKIEIDMVREELESTKEAKTELETRTDSLQKEADELRKQNSYYLAENEEKRLAELREDYEGQIAALNEQIALMESDLEKEKEKAIMLIERKEVEVKLNRKKEEQLAQQVESLSRELNEANERTRAVQKETEERVEKIDELNRRVESAVAASRVVQEQQREKERELEEEHSMRLRAEERSEELANEKKEWESKVATKEAQIAELKAKKEAMQQQHDSLNGELEMEVKKNASVVAEVRQEMHNIQQNCVEQIETVQFERQNENDRFAKEREEMEKEALALQNAFVKQREEMEKENEAEKKRIVTQYEKERSKLTSEFEKEKKALLSERDDALSSMNKEMKSDMKKTKQDLDAQYAVKLEENRRALEKEQKLALIELESSRKVRLTQLQIAAQTQFERMKEEFEKRMNEQKQEMEEKAKAMPVLGFSSVAMIDPFADLSESPMDAGTEAGAAGGAEAAVVEEKDPFEELSVIGDFSKIEVPEEEEDESVSAAKISLEEKEALRKENEELMAELKRLKEENEHNIQVMTEKLELIANMQLETQEIEEKLEEATSQLETEKAERAEETKQRLDKIKDLTSKLKLLKAKNEKLKESGATKEKPKKRSLFSRKEASSESESSEEEAL